MYTGFAVWRMRFFAQLKDEEKKEQLLEQLCLHTELL